jgi:hypothetical protein
VIGRDPVSLYVQPAVVYRYRIVSEAVSRAVLAASLLEALICSPERSNSILMLQNDTIAKYFRLELAEI